MTKAEIKAALDRVMRWSPQRQQDAVAMLRLIEEHDASPYRLDADQEAEVRRRLAETNPPALTLEQLDFRLRRLGDDRSQPLAAISQTRS